MSERLLIQQVMSQVPVTVSVGESVRTAKGIMDMHEIRHLPVVDGSEVIGIVSEREVLLAMSMLGESSPDETAIENICVFEDYAVEPTTPLVKVLTEMAERHIGSALVMSSGHLLGIFTSTDACKLWAKEMKGEKIGNL